MRWSLALLVSIAACQPFGTTPSEETATEDMATELPPKPPAQEQPVESPSGPSPEPVPTFTCDGATFCDDFEGGAQGNGQWTNFAPVTGDLLALTAPSAVYGAKSLGIVVLPNTSSQRTAIRRTFGKFGHMELAFALQLPASLGASGHANVAHLDFGDDLVVTVIAQGSALGLVLLDEVSDFELLATVNVTTKEWHTVKVVVDLPGTPATASFSVDGVDVIKDQTLAVDFSGPPVTRVVLGPDFKSTPSYFELRYDNVRIDAR